MELDKKNYNLLIAKKTEKIVTAIYLISQFLKDNESLKNEMRNESNRLLRLINSIAFSDNENIFVVYKNSLDCISSIISFLTVSKEANLISRMNVDIVIEALRILENILAKKQFVLSRENLYINEENILGEILSQKNDLFVNTNTSFDVISERNNMKNIFLDKNNFSSKIVENENAETFIKDIIKTHKGQNIKDNFKINKFDRKSSSNSNDNTSLRINEKTYKMPKNKDRKDNRRDQILGLFTKGVEVSINDISKKIVGCSVKTIQRELNDLVDEKRIKKIGEKRWSKYTLN